MAKAPTKRRAPATRVRLEGGVKLTDPASVVSAGVIKWVAWVAGTLVLAGAAWTAWNALGLPKVATYDYVTGQIREVVQPIASKVDSQGVYILSGRIETLKGSRAQQLDAKNRLELQLHTTKDPVAVQIIQGQQKSIEEVVKSLDAQIVDLSAQLKALH